MTEDSILQFLCDTFKRGGVMVSLVSRFAPITEVIDPQLRAAFRHAEFHSRSLSEFLGTVERRTIYKLTDPYGFCYLFFLLHSEGDELFFLGPYVPSPLSLRHAVEFGEQNKLGQKQLKVLSKFCAGVPILPDSSHLFLMLDTYLERHWGNPNYAVVDINREFLSPPSPISRSVEAETTDQTMFHLQLMEKRYRYENEILDAVALGQTSKATQLFSQFSEASFERRAADPLRNLQNYCITMNTLLRKSAERGGVHPVYLDQTSAAYAVRIEEVTEPSEAEDLMREMFRAYCRLVRKHAMKDLSLLVQKTILFIDSDLSANLSLSTLAAHLKVSPGYLSNTFKAETGKTVTQFIRERRMEYACHLLTATHLQIQTVAVHCGILDLQYFSKLFKRHTGMTPKQYRSTHT